MERRVLRAIATTKRTTADRTIKSMNGMMIRMRMGMTTRLNRWSHLLRLCTNLTCTNLASDVAQVEPPSEADVAQVEQAPEAPKADVAHVEPVVAVIEAAQVVPPGGAGDSGGAGGLGGAGGSGGAVTPAKRKFDEIH